jgi:hypothetical protein
MQQVRAGRAWGALVVLAAAVGACETARNPSGSQPDRIPPSITLSTTADTQQIASGLQFSVSASDNLGLKDVRLTYSGGYIAQTDTIFNSAVTSFSKSANVTFPANSGAGGFITIIGRAIDGQNNFAEDTIVVFLSNVQALSVTLLAPTTGAIASPGRNIVVSVRAQQVGGIQRVGFTVVPRSAVTDPTTPPTDSLVFTGTLPTDTTYTDTLTVSPSFTTGSFTVAGFAVDAGSRRAVTPAVTVNIQSVQTDNTPPVVSHTIPARVEATDTITVRALDPSGIAWIGFRVDTVLTAVPPFTGITPARFDSVNVGAGNLTDVTRKLSLGLTALATPVSVVVRGYACDLATARNCAFSQTSTVITPAAPRAPARAATPSNGVDTVVVVAGRTFALPLGGNIADAIFNANLNELYLTNPTRHRVEVFQAANSTFVASGITFGVGVPWGVALWPRDTLGNYGDSIVVADAGGTQLAIVDVRTAVRQLQWRQDLPNFLIETYKVLRLAGGTIEEILVHDVSDRPQYVATVCRAGNTPPNCAPDSIFAVYSTTPTQSSTSPFAGKATLRMEKLVSPTSGFPLFGHLFWEIGATFASTSTDTLRIEEVRRNSRKVILSACRGISVDLPTFGLGDSTYTRNSGNFTHAFVGEGGNISTAFARVMAYDARRPITGVGVVNSSCVNPLVTGRTVLAQGEDHEDLGMSPGVHVSDFISNTGIHVSSIATNKNGLTNVVRADSIYYLDDQLRLKATSCTLATNLASCLMGAPGMDMNYFHDFSPSGSCTPNCGGGTDRNNRFLFAARPDASIDVFDTFDGSQFLSGGAPFSIAIRDPIIGPFRVARDATGTRQFLFGITVNGLVMVDLPLTQLINPNPAPPRR